jgi:hypothetical protein
VVNLQSLDEKQRLEYSLEQALGNEVTKLVENNLDSTDIESKILNVRI